MIANCHRLSNNYDLAFEYITSIEDALLLAHQKGNNINVKNRKASFEYELIETFVAGMRLVGTEIKSIRNGKVNLSDSYCQFYSGELYAKNIHISEYEMGTHNNHEAKRDRKLLLNKKELQKNQKRGFFNTGGTPFNRY